MIQAAQRVRDGRGWEMEARPGAGPAAESSIGRAVLSLSLSLLRVPSRFAEGNKRTSLRGFPETWSQPFSIGTPLLLFLHPLLVDRTSVESNAPLLPRLCESAEGCGQIREG